MTPRFQGNFTQQLPIPEEGIERAVAVMRSGRLHRYNVIDDEVPETVQLENEFAAYMGARFCLACTSGGYALQTALRAYGISPGEPVLTNGFTLSPVPGAIEAAGGKAVLVEVTEGLVIDIDDLARKAESSEARVLMLSHMRGHIADMGALMEAADTLGIAVIEDCAHTMGARWGNVKSGAHGVAACFSTQTYKHINSGEGGFITSDDEELMARATILSGSYMLYCRHAAVPAGDVFDQVRLDTPNCSGRMDNLRAAILRPQLTELDQLVEAWNVRYRAIEAVLPQRPACACPSAELLGAHGQSESGNSPPATDRVGSACRGVECALPGHRSGSAHSARRAPARAPGPGIVRRQLHTIPGPRPGRSRNAEACDGVSFARGGAQVVR